MNRLIIFLLLLCCTVLININSSKAGEFTRKELQAAVNSYLAAAGSGDISKMPLAPEVKYIENVVETKLGEGIWKTPLKIDFHRSLLDVVTGETFTEVIVTDKTHPYVIGTRLKVRGGKIREIVSLIIDEGDWLFNADTYLKWSSREKWDILPAEKRSDRKTLIDAADAYCNKFNDPSIKVPFGRPCARLEGGIYTGNGLPDDRCDVGFPEQGGITLTNRHYVVDEDMGSVVVFLRFDGEDGQPDSHLFRLENGKIRFIHTITVCIEPNCGFPELPPGAVPKPSQE
ncbi:hypothetical protein ACFL1N_00280 [Thermodesulfobacteriota bacterium]